MKNLLVLILVIHSLVSSAQTYYARNYTIRDGLPSNSVRAIFKDSRGQLWIGTDAGVCLFDGKNFKVYNSSHGLAGDRVWAIAEDGQGNMWFGTFDGGLSKFDNRTFTNFNRSNGLSDHKIRELKYDHRHNLLFIGCHTQFCYYDSTGFHEFNTRNGKISQNAIITDFLVGDTAVFIIGWSAKNYRFFPGKDSLEILSKNVLRHTDISACFVSSDSDTVYSFGRLKDSIILVNNGIVRNYGGVGQVFGITEDKRGDLWLAGWTEKQVNPVHKGLYKIQNGKLIHLSEFIKPVSSNGYCVFYDKETDVIWYGSMDQGLYKIPPQLFEYRDASWFGLEDLTITDLHHSAPDRLWMLTDDGVFLVQDTAYEFLGKENFLEGAVHSLVAEKEKLQNMNSWKQGYPVLMKDFDAGNIQNYRAMAQAYLNTFYDMESDSRDQIWVSHKLGFSRLDPDTKNTELVSTYGPSCFIFDEADSIHSVGKWVEGVTIFSDHRMNAGKFYSTLTTGAPSNAQRVLRKGNQVWYGSLTYGLFMSCDGNFYAFSRSDPALPKVINELKMDRSGHILAGAANGEILIGDFEQDAFRVLHRIRPLGEYSGNAILWMQCDRQNFLWAGTNTGIHVIDLPGLYQNRQPDIYVLDEEEGYNDFGGSYAVMDSSGMIWVGARDHLIRINAPLYHQLAYAPVPVKLERIDLYNQQVNWEEYTSADTWSGLPVGKSQDPNSKSQLELRYDQNYLTFYFRSGNLFNPEKDRFQYYLEGFDRLWSPLSGEKFAVYSHLPPGRYKLMVKGTNLHTGMDFIPVEFTFKVKRPWFGTWWFYSLVGLALTAILLIFHLHRIRTIRKREEERNSLYRKLSEIEMQALQAQMNPHFVFNAMNAIQNYILGNKVDAALKYLADFARIIRLTLDNASKKNITLSEEMDYIRAYLDLEKMRFGDKFEDEIHIHENVDDSLVMIPPMILQPYVENAVRHGMRNKAGKGRLLIGCRITGDDRLHCIIEDDGVGRAAAARFTSLQGSMHRSHGTRISEERLALLNDDPADPRYYCHITDLFDDRSQPAGTRVEIWLPVRYG